MKAALDWTWSQHCGFFLFWSNLCESRGGLWQLEEVTWLFVYLVVYLGLIIG
jgi:hypothetical protein